ncbi:hypothetical protein ACIPY5_14930 [Microbacterium sp. NPDC089698]|uniref:hypothetical protein n=1 Tax=Microbacterium sp. NPDC089698 TaxID=3364200 RepID=UPI0038117FE1
MGRWAEFEEKEFETLANAALVMQQLPSPTPVQLFSPGQVLEKSLGFDFATYIDPMGQLYRTLFGSTPGAPGIPRGFFPQHQVPRTTATSSLNVFLQYKRPLFFAQQHRSAIWPRRQEHLAFTVEERTAGASRFAQVGSLDRLELALGSRALVRYVCPSTWRKPDLYERFATGRLLATSTFVAPHKLRLIGGRGYHRRWTFLDSNPRSGVPNPGGPEDDAEDGAQFGITLAEARIGPDAPHSTSELLDSATERVSGVRESLRKYREDTDRRQFDSQEQQEKRMRGEASHFPREHRQLVEEAISLALVARDLRTDWMVAGAAERDIAPAQVPE